MDFNMKYLYLLVFTVGCFRDISKTWWVFFQIQF
jgi:hypothetical protein